MDSSYLSDCICFCLSCPLSLLLCLFPCLCICVSESKSIFFFSHSPLSPLSLFLLSLRINEAADFKDHKIQVASCLISLKVEPSPALSINLSGAPLIKIVLTHVLVRIYLYKIQTVPASSHLTNVFICHLPLGESVMLEKWSAYVFQWAGAVVGCGSPALSEGRRLWFASGCSSRIPPYEIYQLYFWAFSCVRR